MHLCGRPRSIAVETLRVILREKNVTFQRTRTWKRSTDPAFEDKATRIMALYRTCPTDGVVVCFDEFRNLAVRLTRSPSDAPPALMGFLEKS